ncbi:MAG: hypothetical protein QM640_06920 [Niabella sp.]
MITSLKVISDCENRMFWNKNKKNKKFLKKVTIAAYLFDVRTTDLKYGGIITFVLGDEISAIKRLA